jgi:hypothetical protein
MLKYSGSKWCSLTYPSSPPLEKLEMGKNSLLKLEYIKDTGDNKGSSERAGSIFSKVFGET